MICLAVVLICTCKPRSLTRLRQQRLQRADRGGARWIEHEAHAAHAETGEPLDTGIGHAQIHHRDGARAGAERGEGVERAAVVGAVGRRASRSRCGWCRCASGTGDNLLRARIDRMRPHARRRRKAAVVDMHVAVAGIRRCFQLGRARCRPNTAPPARRSAERRCRSCRPPPGGRSGALEQGATYDHVVLPDVAPSAAARRTVEYSPKACRCIGCRARVLRLNCRRAVFTARSLLQAARPNAATPQTSHQLFGDEIARPSSSSRLRRSRTFIVNRTRRPRRHAAIGLVRLRVVDDRHAKKVTQFHRQARGQSCPHAPNDA